MQALYPENGGVPRTPPRPVIVLIVRQSLRGVRNHDEVRIHADISDGRVPRDDILICFRRGVAD